MSDGVVNRQFTRHHSFAEIPNATETWSLGIHIATSRISRIIADSWVYALQESKSRLLSRLTAATDGGGVAKVRSWLPVVRTSCKRLTADGQWTGTLPCFNLPEYGPMISYLDYNETKDFQLDLNHPNFSYITTHWASFTNITQYPPEPFSLPSAFLLVRIPITRDEEGKANVVAYFPCTIDARWALGDNIAGGLPTTNDMIFYGALKETRKPTTGLDSSVQAFLPKQGPSWRTVAMDVEWLNALIPEFRTNGTVENPGWTTLGKAFTDAGLDNSTGSVNGILGSIASTIESAIATTVVDGMSCVGLAENGGNMHQAFDRYHYLEFMYGKDGALISDPILTGKGIIVPFPGIDEANLTKLAWTVTVAGFAFKAGSTPYYLALTVLLASSLMGVIHMLYILITRMSSDSWDTLEELLLLSYTSKPRRRKGDGLVNTCAGIHYGDPLKQTARIRAQTTDDQPLDDDDDDDDIEEDETLHLIVSHYKNDKTSSQGTPNTRNGSALLPHSDIDSGTLVTANTYYGA